MAKLIVYTNKNNGVSICYPTSELPIEDVQAKDTPIGSVIIDTDSLPNEHNYFFGALELDGINITINLNKAKNITKNRLRQEREPLLLAQDVAFQRALESNADTSAIIAEKQRLRDITTLVDTANTVEELKALEVK
jgi:hypothetical protein